MLPLFLKCMIDIEQFKKNLFKHWIYEAIGDTIYTLFIFMSMVYLGSYVI